MAEAREARRQRILSRGADRLAFITGECKSLVPDPAEELEKKDLVSADANREIEDKPSSRITATAASVQHEIETSPSSSTHKLTISDLKIRWTPHDGGDEDGGELLDDQTLRQRRPSSLDQQQQQDREPEVAASTSISWSKAVSSSIKATRAARCILSVAIALGVAFQSLADVRVGDTKQYKVITSIQPTMLLAMANVALVAALALIKVKTVTSGSDAASKNTRANSLLWLIPGMWGDAIELVLVVRKVVASLSADLSLYVVVLVSTVTCLRLLPMK